MKERFQYAPDAGAGSGAVEGQEGSQEAQAQGSKDQAVQEGQPAGKTYTDAELSGIIARKQSEQVDKLLKDLGIESQGSLKDRISALKKYEDAHKSEMDKAVEGKTAAERAAQEAIARAEKAEAKAEALIAGVDPGKMDRFMRLALTYDGETVQDKVAAAIKENPEFKMQGTGAGPAPALGGKVKNQGAPADQAATAAFRAALGLKN